MINENNWTAVEAAAAYEVIDRAADYGNTPHLTMRLAEVLKRLIDDADFRAVALDVWGQLFDGRDSDWRNVWMEHISQFVKRTRQCSSSNRDECLPMADIPRISKS